MLVLCWSHVSEYAIIHRLCTHTFRTSYGFELRVHLKFYGDVYGNNAVKYFWTSHCSQKSQTTIQIKIPFTHVLPTYFLAYNFFKCSIYLITFINTNISQSKCTESRLHCNIFLYTYLQMCSNLIFVLTFRLLLFKEYLTMKELCKAVISML